MDLDCLIELTQAPGLSAYNRAERKMFHLSKEITGVVLPADTFGTHLNNGKTVDEELEIQNFEAAGEVLADIWGGMEIDGYKVNAEYIALPPTEDITSFSATPFYKSRHLIQTQYMTVVLKCDDEECCSPFRTPIGKFFPDRRIPPLIPIKHGVTGPIALTLNPMVHKEDLHFLDVFQRIVMEKEIVPEELQKKYAGKVPYDLFFPSVQEKIDGRVCKVCSKYFSTLVMLTEHKKVCKRQVAVRKVAKKRRIVQEPIEVVEVEQEDEVDQELEADSEDAESVPEEEEDIAEELVQLRPIISIPQAGGVEMIVNLKEWLKSPWQLIADD